MNPNTDPSVELPAEGFLADVSSEHRAFLACFGKFLRLQSGETLIREGDCQESLYVMLSGILHVISSAKDRNVLLASFGPGESIGEINLFDPATASATAITRSPVMVWAITREELEAFIETDPAAGVSVMRGLLREVAKRIRGMNEKLISAEQRASLHNFWSADPA